MGRAAAERRGRDAAAPAGLCIAAEGPYACREAGEAGGGWEIPKNERKNARPSGIEPQRRRGTSGETYGDGLSCGDVR